MKSNDNMYVGPYHVPQNLYFVDSIFAPIDGEQSFVTLLKATHRGEPRVRTLTLNNRQLRLNYPRTTAKEGWYVYYHEENQERPLTYGNFSGFARDELQRFYSLQDALLEEFIGEESDSDTGFLSHLAKEEDLLVTSYHVNVGHGNCSIILIEYDDTYELWMVDCSLSERGDGVPFKDNIRACFDAIKKRLGFTPQTKLHISRFFLTHPHFDHYSGIEHLAFCKYFDSRTKCYVNYYYNWPYPKYTATLAALLNAKVKFIEPVYGNSQPAFSFLHPECRIYRNKKTAKNLIKPNRIVGSPINNSSTVIRFRLANKVMVFPGDLEQAGFQAMIGTKASQFGLYGVDYYAVSHHGSLNGHPNLPWPLPRGYCSGPLCCISNGLQKTILMGRDGAYPGIYHPTVTSYWSGLPGGLVYTEKAPHYVELDWKSGTVSMM